MSSPVTGMSPSRARPSRNPRRRIARSSSGSRPSWSRKVDHACACTRNSSAVQRTGAPSPRPVASATSACSAVASAAGSAAVRVRSSSRMIVPAESAPSSPAASAAATCGNTASIGSPVKPERTRVADPNAMRRRASNAETCVTRSTSSTAERQPMRVERRWSPSSTRERSATSPAKAARCASTSRPSASSAPRLASSSSSRHPDASSNPSAPASAERMLLERVAGAGHGSILAGPTDIRINEKQLISLWILPPTEPLWRTSAEGPPPREPRHPLDSLPPTIVLPDLPSSARPRLTGGIRFRPPGARG